MTYKIGSKGEIVRKIQRALYTAGFPCGCIDGIYGKLTEEAVMAFQKSRKLNIDGIVGPATMAKLIPSAVINLLGLKKSKRTINEIIIHCTATPEGRDYSVSDIRSWHLKRGFSDIGYHYVIHRDGKIDTGRDVDLSGAHCTGHNAHSIGVVYVGGLKWIPNVPVEKLPAKDTRTLAQKASMLKLLEILKEIYPNAKIHGHRDFANKECPSFDATTEYKYV
jgi:N-acetylmuramoyl-L-alanine amidase